jgi:hypothetical protein
MLNKMIKILKIIKDYLWCNEERDNIVVIPGDRLIENNLSIEDIKILLETLINKNILEEYSIEDRLYHDYPTSYEDKIKYMKDSFPFSGIYSKKILGTPLYFIKIKDRKKLMKFTKNEQGPNILQNKQKAEFNSQIGVITYGTEQYKIQSDVKLPLMRKLWEERKEIKINQDEKEEIIRKGEPWLKSSLARNIEKPLKETDQAIKDLNGIFRKRKFSSLKIKKSNGVQLVVEL